MGSRSFGIVVLIILLTACRPARPMATVDKAPGLPVQAVGVLELTDQTICSGVVVGPDVVLTSAHCLFGEDNRPAGILRFRAGVREGRAKAEARVIDRFVPPGFDPVRFLDTNDIDDLDWAFLRLDRVIGADTGIVPVRVLSPAELEALKAGGRLSFGQVGYGRGDGRYATALTNCHIVEWWDDHTYAHTCGTVAGDSGSPNLLLEDGVYKVIGIESAEADIDRVEGADMVVASGAFAKALARYLESEHRGTKIRGERDQDPPRHRGVNPTLSRNR